MEEKRQWRNQDEARKPLQAYREEELQQMWLNFFGADHSYHLARKHFVYKGNLPARERGNGDFGCKSNGLAEILDGRAMSEEIKEQVRAEVRRFVEQQGQTPGLAIVRVEGDAASRVIARRFCAWPRKWASLFASNTSQCIRQAMKCGRLLVQLNHDRAVHGLLVQMPLPAHLSHTMVAATIAASKDIDGISLQSAANLLLGLPSFLPATAAAVMELLERTQSPLEGRHVVVISRSNVVGKPLALMLLQKHATVTMCHSRTANLAKLTRQADVLVAAAADLGW